MRAVSGEFKDIQAGIWEVLNSNCPSGAAVDAYNVDFPSQGGVRRRRSFDQLASYPGQEGGAGSCFALPWEKGWIAFKRTSDTTEAPMWGPGVSFSRPLVSHANTVGSGTLLLHQGGLLTFAKGATQQVKDKAYVTVLAGAAETTYRIDVGTRWVTYYAPQTTDPNANGYYERPKLDLSSLNLYSGTSVSREFSTNLPGSMWFRDEEYPHLITCWGVKSGRGGFQFREWLTGLQRVSMDGTSLSLVGGYEGNPNPTNPSAYALWGIGSASGDGKGTWRPVIPYSDDPNSPCQKLLTGRGGRGVALYFTYNERQLNPSYNLQLQEANHRYQEQLLQWQTEVQKRTQPSYIVQQLVEALRGINVPARILDGATNTLVIEGQNPVTATDSGTGTAMRAVVLKQAKLADLPARAEDGDLAVVDGLTFRYNRNTASWKEAAPYQMEVSNTAMSWFGGTSMIGLDSQGLWALKRPSAGTEESLADVLGGHIPVWASEHLGRMVFVSHRGVFVSAVGAPLDFFPSSLLTKREDDGYYIPVSNSPATAIVDACIFGGDVYLLTKDSLYRVGIQGSGNTYKHKIASWGCEYGRIVATNMGVMVFDVGEGTFSTYLLEPSPEGNKVTPVPYLLQLDPRKPRGFQRSRSGFRVSVGNGGASLCIWMGPGREGTGEAFLVDLGQVPRVRRYKSNYGVYMAYCEKGLVNWIFRPDTKALYVHLYPRGEAEARGDAGEAWVVFHVPPEFRTYAPDGRYTFKQFTVYPERGNVQVSVAGYHTSQTVPPDTVYRNPLTLNLGLREGHPCKVAGEGDWWIKAAQYTVLVRNGKTPSGWQ